MSHSLGAIGYFQLNNLVRNKVPFSLFAINLEIPAHLEDPMKSLVKGVQMVPQNELTGRVKQLNLKPDHPMVLLCQQGEISQSLAAILAEQGFLNVYYIKGGWNELLNEGC